MLEDYLDLFYYDETSPSYLRWAVERRSGKGGCKLEKAVGDIAGDSQGDGYYRVPFNGKRLLAHRVVWELLNGRKLESTEVLDHIDGNRGNNSPDNIRVATRALNARNHKVRCTNKTGVTGVSMSAMNEGRYVYYVASWMENGRRKRRLFAVDGNEQEAALDKATKFRRLQIERMNKSGAGYTDRHNQKGE